MSPERKPIATPTTPLDSMEVQRRRFALSSWETVSNAITLSNANNDLRQDFFNRHRGMVRSYYEAQVDIATNRGREKWEKFIADTDPVERRQLKGYFKIVKQKLGLEAPKASHGWAKRIRNEKAALRRG